MACPSRPYSQPTAHKSSKLICWRAWSPMSLYAKDTIVVNAYISCSDIPDVPRLIYKAFRLSCAWCLILAAGTLKWPQNLAQTQARPQGKSMCRRTQYCPTNNAATVGICRCMGRREWYIGCAAGNTGSRELRTASPKQNGHVNIVPCLYVWTASATALVSYIICRIYVLLVVEKRSPQGGVGSEIEVRSGGALAPPRTRATPPQI
jgi:hypothetical protein